ncbi:hypothetical protein D6D10_08407 [Aureobasidium pullulans]|uniref:Uncharacterized protein n=1 Tax=Aureobasidium pullulans TaxID=5580 RepID=A0A4S9EBD7_AURPU|nr:hypothetical protein D6D10_08407 [Aureobasidium pullulans]
MISTSAPKFMSLHDEGLLRQQAAKKTKRRSRKSKASSKSAVKEEPEDVARGVLDDAVKSDTSSADILDSTSDNLALEEQPWSCQTSSSSTSCAPSDSEDLPSNPGESTGSSSVTDSPSRMPGSYPTLDKISHTPLSRTASNCSDNYQTPSRLRDSLKSYCSSVHAHLHANNFLPNDLFPTGNLVEGTHKLHLNDGTVYEPDAHISFLGAEVPAIIFNICWSDIYGKRLKQLITAMIQTNGRLRCAILISLHKGQQSEVEAIERLIQAGKISVTVLKLYESEDGETHVLQSVYDNLEISSDGTETVLVEWKDLTPAPWPHANLPVPSCEIPLAPIAELCKDERGGKEPEQDFEVWNVPDRSVKLSPRLYAFYNARPRQMVDNLKKWMPSLGF